MTNIIEIGQPGAFGNFTVALTGLYYPADSSNCASSEARLELLACVKGDFTTHIITINYAEIAKFDIEKIPGGFIYNNEASKKELKRQLRRAFASAHNRPDLIGYFPTTTGWIHRHKVFVAGDEILPCGEVKATLPSMARPNFGLRLAVPEDWNPGRDIPRFLASLMEMPDYRILAFSYTIATCHRSIWKEAGIPFSAVFYIYGESGLGKSTLSDTFCMLYNNQYGIADRADADSSKTALKYSTFSAQDRTISFDDLCISSNDANDKKRFKNGMTLIHFVSNSIEEKKMRGNRVESIFARSGLVVTAERPPLEFSDISRCILLKIREANHGGTPGDRCLAAGALREYLSWFACHYDEEYERIKADWEKVPQFSIPKYQRVWKAYFQLNWSFESFLRFVSTIHGCKPLETSAVSSLFETAFDFQYQVTQALTAPLKELLATGIQTGHLKGFEHKGVYCTKLEDLLVFVQQARQQPNLSWKQLSEQLKSGMLIAMDASGKTTKKVSGTRYIHLVLNALGLS